MNDRPKMIQWIIIFRCINLLWFTNICICLSSQLCNSYSTKQQVEMESAFASHCEIQEVGRWLNVCDMIYSLACLFTLMFNCKAKECKAMEGLFYIFYFMLRFVAPRVAREVNLHPSVAFLLLSSVCQWKNCTVLFFKLTRVGK